MGSGRALKNRDQKLEEDFRSVAAAVWNQQTVKRVADDKGWQVGLSTMANHPVVQLRPISSTPSGSLVTESNHPVLQLDDLDRVCGRVWLPSQITRFSNQASPRSRWLPVWLPSQITRFSNYYRLVRETAYVWLPSQITRFSNRCGRSRRSCAGSNAETG